MANVEICEVEQGRGKLQIVARHYPQCTVLETLPGGKLRVELLESAAGHAAGAELTVYADKVTTGE